MENRTTEMINFKPISISDKELYMSILPGKHSLGCEYSFANLFLWGRQNIAFINDHVLLFSQFNRRSVYPYPMGAGDKKTVLDAIIADSKARGIPCRITGLSAFARQELERLYPGKFRFHCDQGAFDYVYDINALAELSGKKFHGKRNHLNRFKAEFPDYMVEPLGENNLPRVREMVADWYKIRRNEDPNGDYYMEEAAIEKAFRHYKELGMDGLVLLDRDRVLAFTMGSRLSDDTVDVHFEKARPDASGAYTAINYEFARYIRSKYPQVKFLDREEDMGLEGLRKAKQSYHPHHLVEKCWACLLEDEYDY